MNKPTKTEMICPKCSGTGSYGGAVCGTCMGNGTVTVKKKEISNKVIRIED